MERRRKPAVEGLESRRLLAAPSDDSPAPGLPASSVLPLNYVADPFGPGNPNVPTAEVVALYKVYLDRDPDAVSEANAVAYLKGGGSLGTLALILSSSPEYDTRVVSQDYEAFAGRAGSPSEVAAWVTLMQHGVSAERAVDLMLTSPGFNALEPTDTSFVQAL